MDITTQKIIALKLIKIKAVIYRRKILMSLPKRLKRTCGARLRNG